MTRLPELRDELVAAAARQQQAPVRKRRSLRVWSLSALFTFGAAATAGAVAVAVGVVGGQPTAPYGGVDEQGRAQPTKEIVIATGEVSSGRIEIVAYREKIEGEEESLLCFSPDIVADAPYGGGSCGRPQEMLDGDVYSYGEMDDPLASGRAKSAPTLVDGALTRRNVKRITVRYETRRKRGGVSRAQLFPISVAIARRLDVKPFTFYLAEIPHNARPTTGVAFAPHRTVLWRAPGFRPR